MKTKGILALVIIMLAAAGCGGTTAETSGTVTVNFSILQAEGVFLVEGTVYDDFNGDGIMDVTETGIEGVSVTLLDSSDTTLDSTLTDGDGYYAFALSLAGTYKVVETDPAGYVSTTPNEVTFDLVDQVAIINFGDKSLLPTYSIYGTVFEDANGSGYMETGEAGIEGVTVSLTGLPDTVTGASGQYAFAVTLAGPYSVSVTEPEGYMATTPSPVDITVTDLDVQVDFGLLKYMDVSVDVKPGSEKNPINLKSNGVLPIAVLGSEGVDVAGIDPETVRLNGVAPLRWSIEDVCGAPGDPEDQYLEDDEEMPDGYDDLTLKFSKQEIVETFGAVEQGDIVVLSLEGAMFDGTAIMGEDAVYVNQIAK